MSRALQRDWIQDEATPDLEEGLATIRAARSQVEAETHAFLEEQARLRAEAVLRAVPVDQLVRSRNEDLKRLEGERQQAERRAIEAIERRMEISLRAIESDNARIIEEERATVLATERLHKAREAMSMARGRQEEEAALMLQIQARQEQEQSAREEMERRIEAELELLNRAREKQALEARLHTTVMAEINEMQWAQRVLGLEVRLRQARRRNRAFGVTLGIGIFIGILGCRQLWGGNIYVGFKTLFGLH
ncbi:hypothetical protein [Ferrovum sp.]|uniref:hypothetical protein n=1 Tax=Ferrovum sp. TaxID=2609467 RepID=UPI0026027E1B|nr:hypothetical protein [Ferrovum sp.]